MAATGEVIAEAIVNIRATTDRLKRDMNVAMTIVKRSMNKMKTVAVAAMGHVIRAAKLAAAAISALGLGAAKASASLETMRVSFESALGSASAAGALLEELKAFSASTPFQLEGIAGATRQLLAAGVASKDITAQLRVLGDIAAGANVPLDSMASIFSKVKNKGKAMTREILQLSDAGIPIIRVLAKQLGVAETQVFALAEAGEVSFSVLTAALESMAGPGGIFFNQMALQSRTLSGLWSTLKDVVFLLAAAIGDELSPDIKSMTESLIDAAKGAKDTAKFIGDMYRIVKAVVQTVLEPVRTLANMLKLTGEIVLKIGKSIVQLYRDNIGPIVDGVLAKIGNTLKWIDEHTPDIFKPGFDPSSPLKAYVTEIGRLHGTTDELVELSGEIMTLWNQIKDAPETFSNNLERANQLMDDLRKKNITVDTPNSNKVADKIKEEKPLQEDAERAASILSEEIRDSFASAGQALRDGDFESIFNNIITSVFDRTVENMLNTFADAMAGSAGKSGGGGLGGFISGAIGFIFGGGKGDAAGAKTPAPAPKADGGRFMGGSTHLVGERGPELAHFSGGGSIIPNDELGGGSRQTINITNNNDFNVGDTVSKNQLGAAMNNLRSQIPKDIAKISRDGGRNGSLIRGE